MNEPSKQTITEIMVDARALIIDCRNWTQHTNARDRNLQRVDFSNPDACMWCATGAVGKTLFDRFGFDVASIDFHKYLSIVMDEFSKTTVLKGYRNTSIFNDTQDHAAVIGAFDETIDRLRAAE